MSVIRFPAERRFWPCQFDGCRRSFRTERGERQHERQCLFDFDRPGNPYIPIRNLRTERIVGFCLNDAGAIASLRTAAKALGLEHARVDVVRSVSD